MDWRPVIRERMNSLDGLATRQQLLADVPAVVLDGHIGRGLLVRVFPHVYRLKEIPEDEVLLLREALLHSGSEAAISHTTALAVWGVRALDRPLHLTVDESIRRAGTDGLIVHRRKAFDPDSAQCVERAGLRVTRLARAVVDSWPLLPEKDRRPLALDVVNRRLVTGAQLQDALVERPNVPGRRGLGQTIDLVADGVRSEFEARGVLSVFRHKSLPRSVGQYRLPVSAGTVWLDRAWPEVKLAVELDGAAHHTSPEDRKKDLARDRELAALGWIVLRFTYADVLRDPEGVRAKVLEVYRVRLEQLRAG